MWALQLTKISPLRILRSTKRSTYIIKRNFLEIKLKSKPTDYKAII